MVELLAVVGIVLIVTAVAIPSLEKGVNEIRLSESSSSYANLLQQARVLAIRNNQYYQVLTGTLNGKAMAFVDVHGTGSFVSDDPVAVFESGVVPQTLSATPSLNNLELQFLPSGSQNTVNAANGPTFGTRGLPCTPVPTTGLNGTCPYLSSTNNFLPTSYIAVLQNTQSGRWQAITLTPGARIQRWSYNGTSTWSALN